MKIQKAAQTEQNELKYSFTAEYEPNFKKSVNSANSV
jgi:hypothetical protein